MFFRFPLYLQYFHFLIITCVAKDFGIIFPQELHEGSQCKLNTNNELGVCKKLNQCPKILLDILQGLRNPNSNDLCGIFGSKELVCCPAQRTSQQIGLRPADVACQQIESRSTFSGRFTPNTLGKESVDGEFPFVASLGYRAKNNIEVLKYNCGGSLISAYYVLTAAHCLVNIDNNVPVEVRLGSINLEYNTEDVERILISNVYPHPKFKISEHYFDIGLVKLLFPVQISATIRPICLNTKPVSIVNSKNGDLITVGYGIKEFGQESPKKLLKSFDLKLVSKHSCDEMFAGARRLPFGLVESMLCGKDANETRGFDVCQGDSGGPMFLRKQNLHVLVGVISFGAGCFGLAPTVYTSIYPYLDWIESQVWRQ